MLKPCFARTNGRWEVFWKVKFLHLTASLLCPSLTDMSGFNFGREFIHLPVDFDEVVTSHMFGDMCAESIDVVMGQ